MAAKVAENKTAESPSRVLPIVLVSLALMAGLLIALPLLPGWVSNLSFSYSGKAPRIYWYLSRSAGLVALTILWASMAFGLGITNKMARIWPGAPAAFAIHEFVSVMGLGFAVYHALVLMGDHYTDFSLPKLLVPFSIQWIPVWIGLGQLAFYLWLLVTLSFYVRQRIGPKLWRMIHYVNFAIYAMGLTHGIFTGSDSVNLGVKVYYWFSAGSLLALLGYRIYGTLAKKQPAARAKTVAAAKPAAAVSAATPVATAPSPAKEASPVAVPAAPVVATASAEQVAPAAVKAEVADQPAVKEPDTIPVAAKAAEVKTPPPARNVGVRLPASPTIPRGRQTSQVKPARPATPIPTMVPAHTFQMQKNSATKMPDAPVWEKVLLGGVQIQGTRNQQSVFSED